MGVSQNCGLWDEKILGRHMEEQSLAQRYLRVVPLWVIKLIRKSKRSSIITVNRAVGNR